MTYAPDTLSSRAMELARSVHKNQRRKYTGNPYFEHLAEVAGIAMGVGWRSPAVHPDTLMAVAWLHDAMEDQGVRYDYLAEAMSVDVAAGVFWLTDSAIGDRAGRKAASRARLALAPGWVQTIKVADVISNCGSIREHDPEFARTYLAEKRALLEVLTKADPRLLAIAREVCAERPTMESMAREAALEQDAELGDFIDRLPPVSENVKLQAMLASASPWDVATVRGEPVRIGANSIDREF